MLHYILGQRNAIHIKYMPSVFRNLCQDIYTFYTLTELATCLYHALATVPYRPTMYTHCEPKKGGQHICDHNNLDGFSCILSTYSCGGKNPSWME